MPLGTEQEVAGDPTGVMVERSESEERRPDGEARDEPTQRVTSRGGAPQRAIDAGRGGDMMRSPSRPPKAPERRTDDSMSSRRRRYSAGHRQRRRLAPMAGAISCTSRVHDEINGARLGKLRRHSSYLP